MHDKIKWKLKLFAYRWHKLFSDLDMKVYEKTKIKTFYINHLQHDLRSDRLFIEAMAYLADFADSTSSTKEDEPT